MRGKDKFLPNEHEAIVYYSNGICIGFVAKNSKGKLCVNSGFKQKEVKTGFLWCYQKDILKPEEI